MTDANKVLDDAKYSGTKEVDEIASAAITASSKLH